MRVICRVLLVGLLLPGPFVLAGRAQADVTGDAPVRGGKTVKECNDELSRNAAALETAGESASAFFHACWFHSEKGKPTPIVAKGEGESRPDGQPAPKAADPARATVRRDAGSDGGRRVARRAVRHAARRAGERRVATARQGRGGGEPVGLDDAAIAPVAVQREAGRLPGHVNLGVPIIGTVAVPILPGLEATVQSVVEHPVVPGLISTSP